VVTAGLVLSGSFKEIEALDFLPVDATLALAAIVAALVAMRLLSEPVPRAAHIVFFGFLLLIPAAFFTAPTEYGAYKEMRLFTITFLSMLAPVVLIRDRTDVRRHLLALAGVAGIVVAEAVVNPQPSSDYEGAPIMTESAGTIGLGTAAAVVVVIATMGMIWRAIPWQVALPAGGAAIYVLLQSGSRGPLFATVLAILVGVFLVRVRPSLGRALFFVSLVGVGILVAFSLAPFYSRDRIIDLLTGDTAGSVDNRVRLLEIALDVVNRSPMGVGWGGYQAESFAGYRYPHNLPLEVLVEAGLLFGGIFLVWLLLCAVRAHRATVDFYGGTLFAVLACVFAEALVSGDLNDNRLTFYVLGIAVAAASLLPVHVEYPRDADHRQGDGGSRQRPILAEAARSAVQERSSLTLRQYVEVVRARWHLVIAGVLLGLLAAVTVTLSTPPQYESDVTIHLSARPAPGDASGAADRGELAAQRIPTYFEVIIGERMATEVARALGPDVSPLDVAARISATRPQDTVLLTATVTDPSPEQAARIANLVADLVVDLSAELERPTGSAVPPLVTAQVFEPAEVPTEPALPRPWVNLALGALLGVLGGLGLALLRHRTDTSVRSGEQIRTITGVPVLGAVAAEPAISRAPLIVQHEPVGRNAEAFRRLRTNLQFADVGRERAVWLVTSPTPGDDKTAIVGNLAAVMADAGSRVLVVEADLRRPRIAELLGADRHVGLTDVLVRRKLGGQAVQHVRSGLDVLAGGPLPPNPGELLGSPAMADLLAQARENYEVVLIDASPLTPVADAVPLTRGADGVLLVVPSGAVSRQQLEVAREALDAVSAPLVGTVLTGIPAHRQRRHLPDDAYLAAWAELDMPGERTVTTAHGNNAYPSR
jgi:capsular exopolysaccharide synthesis family protein